MPGEKEIAATFPETRFLNWPWIVQYALRHGLAPLFWRGLGRLDERFSGLPRGEEDFTELSISLGTPRELFETLRESYLSTMRRNLLFQAVLDELDSALTGTRITCLVWKGAALALETYRHPGLRPMDDLDLLVLPESIDDLKAILRQAGFKPRPGYPLVWARKEVTLDLHPDVVHSDRISSRLQALPLTARAMASKAYPLFSYHQFKTLCKEDTLISIAVHAMKHGFSRDMWLADAIYHLDRHPELGDHPKDLLARAESLQAIVPLSLLASLVSTWQDYPHSKLINELCSRRLGFLHRRFIVCFIAGRPVPHIGELFFAPLMRSQKARFVFLWETVFPSRRVMDQLFPNRRMRPYWLYYPHRIVRLAIMGMLALKTLIRP